MKTITLSKVARHFLTLVFCTLLMAGVNAQPISQADSTLKATIHCKSPAVNLTAKSGEVTVGVHATEGVLPEGTQLRVKLLSGMEQQVYVRSLKQNSGIAMSQASYYDITLFDRLGHEIQPNGEVTVSFSGLESANNASLVVLHAESSNQDGFSFSKKYPAAKAQEKMAVAQYANVHPKDIQFKTSHFSVYVVGTTQTATYNFLVNGILEETQIVLNGESLLEPEMPVAPTGKRFTGWYVQGQTVPVAFHQAVSVPATITYAVNAKFEDVWYVFFNYNGELVATKDVVPPATTTSASGIPLVINVPGKVFSHWSATVDGPVFNFNTSITANTTLYAVLTDRWVVTFNTQGGSPLMPEYIIDGQNATPPVNPTKIGFAFTHWSETIGGPAFNFSSPITGSKTLYAVWTPQTVNYTVVYWQQNAGDNEYAYFESRSRTGVTGSVASFQTLSYTGFTLNTVKTNEAINNVNVKGDGSTVKNVYYDRNVWTFTVEYKNSSNQWITISATPVKFGQSTALWYNAAVNANPGYRWLIARGSTTSYSEAPDMPNKNLTISGEYSGNTPFTIHYMEKNTNITIHDDYVFYAAGNGNFQFSIEDGIAIEGFTVTNLNQWEPLNSGTPERTGTIYYTRNNYNITFNTMDGGAPVISAAIAFEASVENQAPAGYVEDVTTRIVDGITYTFGGWYETPVFSAETKFNFAGETMPAHNLVLYAKWTAPTFFIINHQVLQNPGSTNNMVQIPVPYGSTIDINDLEYEIPAGLDENDFVGWYWYVGDLFVPYDFGMAVYFQFELFPVWNEHTYSVAYSLNGASGTVPTDDNIYHLGAGACVAGLPADVVPPAGKVFIGWNDQNGIKAYPNNNHTITGDMTFSAQWENVTQKTGLTYKANGGNGDDVVLELDNNVTHIALPANTFTYSGYTFAGWNTAANGSGVAVAPGAGIIVNNSPELPNVLYAQWASTTLTKTAADMFYCYENDVVNYTITFTNNGNVALYAPEITDATATAGPDYISGDSNTNGVLDAGESWIYGVTYSITNSDILAGSHTNTAEAIAYADMDGDGTGDQIITTPGASSTVNLADNCCTLESVSVAFSPIACNGGTSTVTITAIGGHAPLTYTLNGVSQINDGVFTNIPAGVYVWSVSESSVGCTPTLGNLEVTQPTALSVVATVSTVSCPNENDGAINLTLTGGTAPYTVSWSGPDGFSSSNNDITGLTAGNYTLNVTDDLGCDYAATYEVATTPDVT
ncbi:MAG: InlB B-repeat-containing protein, partial [Lentimicrobium sp.]|nr:InlB B-repeat-containing protein [Lentimicrobium sp.]